ncbi:MAG: cbb3-type cytochrome c oxidase subunit II [Phycisphaeraceae bacterium]|nr:cbb3-type cytochrome c oxidase subunit II [Phycisphaeraceae bacterium]
MERFSFIFLVAGLGFFALAFAVSGYVPMLPVKDLDVRTVEQLAEKPPAQFTMLREDYPEAFEKAFGEFRTDGEWDESAAFAEALRTGHKVYVAEACWHCHSQQVRPWGNDEARYGRVSFPEEYHNELNMPPLWGTRRIGPDLIRRGGEQSNDWHVAHFYRPSDVATWSVMPEYPWFYEDDGKTPNKKGLSIIAYVQWLGSWSDSQKESLHTIDDIEQAFPKPTMIKPEKPTPDKEEDTDPAGTEPDPGTGGDGYGDDDGYGGDDAYGEDAYGESGGDASSDDTAGEEEDPYGY